MMFITRFTIGFMAFVLSLACAAQTYPNKPVRIIVPFASGGPTDAMARILAQKFTESVESQPNWLRFGCDSTSVDSSATLAQFG